MFAPTARRLILRCPKSPLRQPLFIANPLPHAPCRRSFSFSSVPPPPPASATSPSTSLLAALTTELDKLAPRFEIDPKAITVIRTPTEFYETIKAKILTANNHIFFSTLYIGTTEEELISTIATALRRNPQLRVSILTDGLRGTRESPRRCSASLLVTLAREFGDRVDIRLYRTPNLRGWRKWIPRRWNEGWGLQHVKIYGFDDEVMLSGANLSKDYFTNRQDRYHIYSDARVAKWYKNVQDAICGFSYKVLPAETEAGFALTWPETNPVPNPENDEQGFKRAAVNSLAPLLQPASQDVPAPFNGKSTFLYPLAQITPLISRDETDISTELPAVLTLLRLLASPTAQNTQWTFTAGYFNPTPLIRDSLLATAGPGNIITAAPEANGFYGSKGVSGALPGGYTILSRRFLEEARRAGREGAVRMFEWKNGVVNQPGGWTYHAKGIWVSMARGQGEEPGPSITIIGSSNYTRRSYSLDLEANALVVTGDAGLKAELGKEISRLEEHVEMVGMREMHEVKKEVGWKVRILLWLFEKRL